MDDLVTQQWQEAPHLDTAEFNPTTAEQLMEPQVIFKKHRAGVRKAVVVNHPEEGSERSEIEEVKNTCDVLYLHAIITKCEISYHMITKVSCVQSHTCPAKIEKKVVAEKEIPHMEIRPLVRLFRKSSPSPPPEHKHQPPSNKPKEKPKVFPETELPANMSNYRKHSYTENRKPSIKFSTSTALYTPPKPSLENYSKPDNSLKHGNMKYRPTSLARSSLFSSYNLTARARSEFRERSIPVIGRRGYVSLYS